VKILSALNGWVLGVLRGACMVYRYRYHYPFVQKVMFLSLWILGGFFVLINFLSNPILSVESTAPVLSMALVTIQVGLLITLWCMFFKASCSMGQMLRWFVVGVVILPYLAQIGLLSFQSL
jgi:hypothetical protein